MNSYLSTTRPAGSRPPLFLSLVSDVPKARDVALRAASEFRAADYASQIEAVRDCSIVIAIDCSGGAVTEAMKFYQALRRHPYSVRAYIIGRASSSAPIIALAADERFMAADATVMLHEPRLVLTKDKLAELRALPVDQRRQIVERGAQFATALADILSAHCGCSTDDARAWMKAERTWSAAEAMKFGLATHIDPTISGTRSERIAALRERYGQGLKDAA
jgi:ATP-dependent protease ClpP protease subunit